jgi:hypothetical protein
MKYLPKSNRSDSRFEPVNYKNILSGSKRSQISMEYIVILGFVMFALVGVLGLAFFYSGTIKDSIRLNQVSNFANKITSTSESVFYYGNPSKATISVYLPDGVENIEISGNDLIISTQTSSGLEKRAFSSNVPLELGSISLSFGIKKLEIKAEADKVTINPA